MGAHLFYMISDKKKAAEFNNVMAETEIGKRLIKANSFCGVNDESDIEIAKEKYPSLVSFYQEHLGQGDFKASGISEEEIEIIKIGNSFMTDYIKEFSKLLHSIDYSKRPVNVFQDFLTVSTISLANTVYNSKELEKEYFEIIKEYKNPNLLAELLTITIFALEEKPQDFLGNIYMRENFGNKGSSQFFTPYHIAECMAQMTLGDELENKIKDNGFITVSDPCCGSGVMAIGMSEALKSKGYNPQKVMWFRGTDIDITCCKMAYIQTSLLGLSGEIIYGNTLTLESWKRFITPMTLFNPKVLNEIYYKKQEEPKKEPEIISEIKPNFTIKQLSIFN